MNVREKRAQGLRRAGDFASQGKWEFAAREYEQLVARDPEDVSARYNLGVAQQRLGNLNDAETAYRRVLASQRNHVAARTNLALVLLNRGEPAAAIVELIRASEDGPGIGLVHFCLGNAYYQQRQWARAVRSFQRAVDLEPDNFEALGQLGASLSAIGDWSGACQAYQRATALKPMEWISNCNWALTLRQLGRLDEAERVFQKVLECVRALPADAVVRDTVCGTLATRLWDADWKREAIEVLEFGLSYSPNDAALRHLLAAFTNQNVPVRAEDEYVHRVFDSGAKTYDEVMNGLRYQGPELITAALVECLSGENRLDRALDIGCGTGLCGATLRSFAHFVAGVDLSAPMLEIARQRGIYDALWEAELTSCLAQHPGSFDLIVAADTLVYFGDLHPVFMAVAQALRSPGWFLFTVEQSRDEGDSRGFTLQTHGRYNHHHDYLERELCDCGLTVRMRRAATLRLEDGIPVAGWLVVATAHGIQR